MKKILIAIPCPLSMRNILTSPRGTFSILKQRKDLDIVLFAPESAVNLLKRDFHDQVEGMPEIKKNSRELFSDFITKNLNMTNMQILGSKYGLRVNAERHKRREYLHFLRLAIAFTLGKSRFFRLRVAPKLHMLSYKRRPLKVLFEKHKFDLVYTPSINNPYGEEVIREAKRQGIPVYGMLGSWDHPHKMYQALRLNKVLVWSEKVKQEQIELQSYKSDDVVVVGAPHYDMFVDPEFIQSREELCKELGFEPSKKIIAFFSATGRSPDDGDLVDMILKWRTEGKINENTQIYIRSYPGDVEGDHIKFDHFQNEKGVFVEWFEDKETFVPLAENPGAAYYPDANYMKRVASIYNHADLFISVYSSVTAEASVNLRQAINVNFDGYQNRPYRESVKRFKLISHFDKLYASGGVVQAENADEFLSQINRALENPTFNAENYAKLRDVVCGNVDGKTSERLANFLLQKLHKEEQL